MNINQLTCLDLHQSINFLVVLSHFNLFCEISRTRRLDIKLISSSEIDLILLFEMLRDIKLGRIPAFLISLDAHTDLRSQSLISKILSLDNGRNSFADTAVNGLPAKYN